VKLFSEHDDYYLKYGLERDPFPKDGIDNIFFTTPELNQRIELIKHLLEFSQQLVLVTLPPGGGKTMLCQYLPSVFNPNWSVNCIGAIEDMTPESLAFAVIRELYPAEYADTVPAIPRLYKYLEHCDREQQLPVIMIDEGQRLSVAALEFILQLNEKVHNNTRLRFVIFGEEGLNRLLEDPRIKVSTTGILHSISIPLLTEQQARAYLEHRLNSTGNNNRFSFSDKDVQHIYKVSGGAPGRINRLARQSMQGPTYRVSRAAPGLMRRLRNPIVLASLVFLLFVLYYVFSQRPAQPQTRQQTAVTSTPTVIKRTPAAATEAAPQPIRREVTPVSQAVTPQPEPVAARVLQPEENPAPAAVPALASIRPQSLSRQFSGIKGDDWLRSQAPQHYVLQVIGAREVATLEQFLAGSPKLHDELVVISTWKDGQPWYVFLYGIYPDHDTALKDIDNLPAAARRARPWPRSVASVQQDLDKTR